MKLHRYFWQSFITYVIIISAGSITIFILSQFIDSRVTIGILSFLVTLGMGVSLSFRIAQPLERLKLQVEKVASGELDEVVDLSRNETLEIHQISSLMDHISNDLRTKIEVIRRQRDEQEAIFTSMDEGVFAIDTDKTITYFNPAARRIFDLSEKSIVGSKLHEVIRIPEMHRICELAIETGQNIRTDTYLGAGKVRWLEIHVSALRDKEGDRYGVVVVVSDVTRIRELEGMRKNFVANVSHELRTPLTSIQGFAETLMNPNVKDMAEAKKFISIIQRHAQRLSRIIEDILTLSRIERDTENSEVELKQENLKEIFDAVVELCMVKAEKKRIVIEKICPENIQVNVDRYLFEHAMLNLLDNAIRYSQEDKKIIMRAEESDGKVFIRVKDQGAGIAEKHLDKIFERFYRVDPSRSRDDGGTGLGLSIVKHIVQAHAGQIVARSKLGEGTEFEIQLSQA